MYAAGTQALQAVRQAQRAAIERLDALLAERQNGLVRQGLLVLGTSLVGLGLLVYGIWAFA